MSNYHLRDKSLSLKAKGLLSLPDNWDYTLSGLAHICMEGKDAIWAAVVELEKAGYIWRGQTTTKDGKFSSNEYIIREHPITEEPSSEEPSSAQPPSENPITGKPATDSTTQINKDSRNKEKPNTDLTSKESFPFLPSLVVTKSAQLRFRLRRKLCSLPCSSSPHHKRFAGLRWGPKSTAA